jgi:hypothetical protein
MAITFSSTSERIQKVDTLVQQGYYPDRSTFINTGIDFLLKTHNTNRVMDFLYFIFPGVFFFLGCIGATLFLRSLFFFVLTGISGLYLMVFIYLYYNKYKGVKKHG